MAEKKLYQSATALISPLYHSIPQRFFSIEPEEPYQVILAGIKYRLSLDLY